MSVGQFEVVSKAAPTPGQAVGKVAFFDANGDPVAVGDTPTNAEFAALEARVAALETSP